jgi:hypothetical protein
VTTEKHKQKGKIMKTLAAAAMALATALSAYAVSTQNTFTAVTNDWYVGKWTNVLELAQTRLAANSNDLVGAHLVVSYDVLFSDIPAISNSVTRLIGAMDASTEPAMTNLISQLRPGWVYFRDEFLPRQTAADVQAQHEKSSITNKTLDCDFILKQIWDNGLW